ncbi:hypothetical protein ACKOZO_002128 [Vibrio vulnificus]|nr:hypothetical protein [Vibrio vulnificus]
MFAKRYSPNELIDIIAAPSYSPEIVNYVKKVASDPFLSQFLSQKPKLGITGTIAKDYVEADTKDAVPYVSTKQVKGLHAYIDDAKYISKEADIEWAKCRVEDGDIIINKSGNVGAAAVLCCAPYKYANSVSDIINIKLAKNSAIDRDYLVVYLNSPYGQKQLQRLSGGAIFSHVSLHAIPDIRVFHPDIKAQKYIGDKVRQAEQLRAWAKRLDSFIDDRFSFLVQDLPSPKKHFSVKPEDLVPYRINPKQYDPIVTGAISKAEKSGVLLERLEGLIDARGIAGGATPKGAEYKTSGVLFCRVQNVKKLALDLSDAVYITKDDDESLKRSRCESYDVVLTITGYPGTASLVIEEDLPVNLNQHSVRFGCAESIKPGYLCAAVNSSFVKLQVERASIGGTRDALDYPSVANLLIPRLHASLEDAIDRAAISYVRAIKASKKLTDSAKTLVEALIEGQLSERQLIQAQQALDDGDNSLDQAILSKLSNAGYAIDGATPLFSDIDELYRLLESAAQAEIEG